MAFALREYQKEAVRSVRDDWRSHSDVLGVMATGGGKTQTYLQLLTESVGADKRALVLAHREELITQPVERVERFWPEWRTRTGIVQADTDEPDRQITVGSVQTLVNPVRLARVLDHGPIDYLVVDESHHSVADSYLSIWKSLKEANPDLRHLGVTATPIRSDKRGLAQVYSRTSFNIQIPLLQKLGYLVPVDTRMIETGISLAGVATRGGDFDQKSLASAWECDNLFELMVESHSKWASGRKAIAFTASVEGAHRLAEFFNSAGISAKAADGTTGKEIRRGILRDFRSGDTDVLCNCFLYTEGLDVPEVSAIHWARPSKSQLVVAQGIGRGLRVSPGKENCIVLFFSPVEIESLVTPGDVLGVARPLVSGQSVGEEEESAGGGLPQAEKIMRGDSDSLMAIAIDLLATSPMAWHFEEGVSTLSLGDRDRNGVSRTLAIVSNLEGFYLVAVLKKTGYREETSLIAICQDYEEATDRGADYALQYGSAVLFRKNRGWEKSPVSEGQAVWIRKCRIGDPSRMTRGEASKRITHHFACRTLAREGWIQKRQAA